MEKKKFTIKDVIYLIIIALLTAGLTVSLVINFTKKSEEPQALSTYYDQKVYSFGVQNANLSKGQTVFLGDSITDLYHLDSFYGELSTAVYNRGIGGDYTLGVIGRLDVSVYQLEPVNLVLMIGINDLNFGRAVEDVAADYKTILQSVKERLPQTKIYCVSVLPMSKIILNHAQLDLAAQNAKVEALNESIRGFCDELDCVYVDLNANVKNGEGNLIDNYTDDGIHLNDAGFAVWKNAMTAAGLS